MKKYVMLMLFGCLYLAGCQNDRGRYCCTTGYFSDMLTYEVITADTSGWYGIWNDENGGLISTTLDSCTWGNAVYF